MKKQMNQAKSEFTKNSKSKNQHSKGCNYRKKDVQYEDKSTAKGDNDITWYMKDASLVEAAGRLNFSNPLGSKFSRAKIDPNEILANDTGFDIVTGVPPTQFESIPGIVAMQCFPYYGVASDSNAPINIAARAMYGKIRSTLSNANLGVDACDLMTYMLAMDNLVSFWAWMTRIYGIASTYSSQNKYLGRKLIEANGVDFSDIMNEYANLRYYIRLFAKKFNNALHMPAGYGLVERHFWLFSNVFKDQDIDKAGLYLHIPEAFYKYQGIGSDDPGLHLERLIKSDRPAIWGNWSEYASESGLSFTQIREYGDGLLDALLKDDDAAIVSSLILRTYGTEQCYKLSDMPDDYAVIPVYNEEILEQIHNTSFVGVPANPTDDEPFNNSTWEWDTTTWAKPRDFDYRQRIPVSGSDPYLYCSPKGYLKVNASTGKVALPGSAQAELLGNAIEKVIDSRKQVPDAATVVIDTRGMSHSRLVMDSDGDVRAWVLATAGLEIYTFMTIIGNYPNLGGYRPEAAVGYVRGATSKGITNTLSRLNDTELRAALLTLCYLRMAQDNLQAFDCAPRLMYLCSNITSEVPSKVDVSYLGECFEYNNYAHITFEELQKIHEAALMGAFDIPIVGKAWGK